MLRSTKIVTAAGCLLALALVSCPNAAQAKGSRAVIQAKTSGTSATRTKIITPSKLLSVKGKSTKTLLKGQAVVELSTSDKKLAGTNAKTKIVAPKYCRCHRRPYHDCWNCVYFGGGWD